MPMPRTLRFSLIDADAVIFAMPPLLPYARLLVGCWRHAMPALLRAYVDDFAAYAMLTYTLR